MKKYIFKSKVLLFLNIIFIMLHSLLNIMLAYTLKYLLDIAENRDIQQFKLMIIFIIVYITLLFTISFIKKLLQAKFIEKTMFNLKQDIFIKIINKSIENFNNEKSAQYISILTNDLRIIESDYYVNILNIVSSVFSFIVACGVLISLNVYIAIGVLFTTLITIFIPQLINKYIQKSKVDFSDKLARFTSKIKDIFSGYEVIKCFNIENKITKDYCTVNAEVEKSKYNLTVLTSLAGSLSFTLAMSMFFTALSIGTYLTIIGSITIGTMIAASQLMNNIANPIVEISNGINILKSVRLLESKIIQTIEQDCFEENDYHKSLFESNIEFKNVSFAYPNSGYILRNISFKIEKGKKYAIVGESGSGKSTLIKLLIKYYENYEGEILVDNVLNKSINTSDLYNLISVIHQNVFIFDGNIRDNITLYNKYEESEINKALELAGLNSTIRNSENKLDKLVGENGIALSGGEKQRISIARAIIRKTPIIILDEPTASLDAETSYNIENSILNLSDSTVIVITHKLNKELLSKYDTIISIKNGNIVEEGDFETLISNKGYFYNLYNLQ
ncbi:MAG: ABC transporter ATP-binding protein [Clostridium argentinense]|uniref:ABC transporter ATP-binding protein n=1 Tax=Clostridium butanoliproducens TaxID=2991837 RepID=UPI001DB1BF0E|nr:ABC transporter ATP-binding protein [Clostridium butanoliproducens]MBS5823971.1 ABC transporter ATP-binding protein [Clostridium argentinense]MDU1348857.1 ABC transporter ATP-binding protein [Clostridium argentinense]